MEKNEIKQSIKIIEETKKLIIENINNNSNFDEKIIIINKMKDLDKSLNEYKNMILKKSKYIIFK